MAEPDNRFDIRPSSANEAAGVGSTSTNVLKPTRTYKATKTKSLSKQLPVAANVGKRKAGSPPPRDEEEEETDGNEQRQRTVGDEVVESDDEPGHGERDRIMLPEPGLSNDAVAKEIEIMAFAAKVTQRFLEGEFQVSVAELDFMDQHEDHPNVKVVQQVFSLKFEAAKRASENNLRQLRNIIAGSDARVVNANLEDSVSTRVPDVPFVAEPTLTISQPRGARSVAVVGPLESSRLDVMAKEMRAMKRKLDIYDSTSQADGTFREQLDTLSQMKVKYPGIDWTRDWDARNASISLKTAFFKEYDILLEMEKRGVHDTEEYTSCVEVLISLAKQFQGACKTRVYTAAQFESLQRGLAPSFWQSTVIVQMKSYIDKEFKLPTVLKDVKVFVEKIDVLTVTPIAVQDFESFESWWKANNKRLSSDYKGDAHVWAPIKPWPGLSVSLGSAVVSAPSSSVASSYGGTGRPSSAKPPGKGGVRQYQQKSFEEVHRDLVLKGHCDFCELPGSAAVDCPNTSIYKLGGRTHPAYSVSAAKLARVPHTKGSQTARRFLPAGYPT